MFNWFPQKTDLLIKFVLFPKQLERNSKKGTLSSNITDLPN